MGNARSRLLLAIVVSAALHLGLIYGIAVQAPASLTSPIVARLQREPPPPGGLPTLPLDRPSPPAVAATRVSAGASPVRLEPASLPVPTAARPGPASPPVPPPDSPLPSVAMPMLADPTWYPAEELDVYPRARDSVSPAYPAQAAQEGIAGEVTLLLMVDERGMPRQVSVAQARPAGYFEAAAIAAFQTARFEPAQRDGRSVRSRILVRVSFDPTSAPGERQSSPPN